MSTDQENPDLNKADDIPAWARDAITKANNQAAEYRIALREEKQRNEALSAEVAKASESAVEFEKNATLREKELLRLQAAVESGLSGKAAVTMAGRLKGETLEELLADVESLREVFPVNTEVRTPAVDPTQGKNSSPEKKMDFGEYILNRLNM